MLKLLNKLIVAALLLLVAACVPQQQVKPAKEQAISPETRQRYATALRLVKVGSDKAALPLFAKIKQTDKTLSGPYVNTGLIYLRQKKWDGAEKEFREAIKRKPDNPTALAMLGYLEKRQARYADARKHYEQALSIQSDYADAHLDLGILCDIYLQDLSCALDHYQEYQRLNGKDKKVNNWVIDLKERMK